MLFTVTYNIDRIHANEIGPDTPFSKQREPYLWTVFFYVDIDSIDQVNLSFVVAHVPLEDHSLRNSFPDGVETGDDVSIPPSIGSHTMVLDDGAQGRALAGTLVLLLEQEGSDGDAMEAGHGALGGAVEAAIDGFILSRLLQDSSDPPTATEIQVMADQIEADVKDAILGASDPWDYFDKKDVMLGFGHQFLMYDQLRDLAKQDSEESLFFHVEDQRPFKLGPFGATIQLIDDYDIFGTVRVVQTPAPHFGVPLQEELDVYSAAVQQFNVANETIVDLLKQLHKASPDRRQPLLAEWKFQRDVVRPQAAKALSYARAQYVSARNRVFPDHADYLHNKMARREKRMQRLSRQAPSRFYRAANVVPSKPLRDRYDESHPETAQ